MRIKLSWKDIQALVLNGLLTDIGIDLSGDTTSIRAVTNSGECEIEILVGENGNTKPEISLNGNSKMEQILRELRVAAAEIEARIYVLKKTRDGFSDILPRFSDAINKASVVIDPPREDVNATVVGTK